MTKWLSLIRNYVIKNFRLRKMQLLRCLRIMNELLPLPWQKKTGLSRAYFYTNEEAHAAYNKAKIEQDGVIFVRPQQVILNTAMEHQLQVLKNRIARLEKENTELRKENEKLKKARNKVDLAFIKKL